MKRRTLRPEERALWNQVAETTERLSQDIKTETAIALTPEPAAPPQALPLPEFNIGSKATPHPEQHQTTRRMRDRLSEQAVKMDARTHSKMTRGKLKPEGRIDLHGMTQAQAHPALMGFIQRSHNAGKRLVLVITGKGSLDEAPWPIPRRRGVLRQLVPDWLKTGYAANAVLQITPAHQRHGGDGAYYVYLRKR